MMPRMTTAEHMARCCISLLPEVLEQVDALAGRLQQTRSGVFEAAARYLLRHEIIPANETADARDP